MGAIFLFFYWEEARHHFRGAECRRVEAGAWLSPFSDDVFKGYFWYPFAEDVREWPFVPYVGACEECVCCASLGVVWWRVAGYVFDRRRQERCVRIVRYPWLVCLWINGGVVVDCDYVVCVAVW